ncbi:hypothetical protein M513_02464 [Trichuris suis]|uniref:Uncharacterized protein n=1 Tax=Trichuris suis TaxID=68888 RepID=A0A085MHU1_9BILA|nr:hypothetical protein M513_02464 [Trichuris suis]
MKVPETSVRVKKQRRPCSGASWKASHGETGQGTTQQRHQLKDQDPYDQNYGLPSSHMYGYESWTIRKADRRGIDAFEL